MAFTSISPVLVLLIAGVATVLFLAITPVKSGSPAPEEAP
jgi:hypothetical protein